MSSDSKSSRMNKWLVRIAIGMGVGALTVAIVAACGVAFVANRFSKLTPEQQQSLVLGAVQYGVTGGAERGFAVIDGQPSFVDANMAVGKKVAKVDEADAETFRIFEHSARPRLFFAADKNRVYVASSFTPHVLPDADVTTFEVLRPSGCWSRDSAHVYFMQVAVPDADPDSFMALSDAYGRDANHAYLGVQKIPTTDIASWEPLDEGMAGTFDAKHRKLPTIEQYEDPFFPSWSRDHMGVYDRVAARDEFDPSSFEVLANRYVKDKAQVFYFGEFSIDNADSASFEAAPKLVGNPSPDARDKNGYFHEGKPWTFKKDADRGVRYTGEMTYEERWVWRCNDAIIRYGTTEQKKAFEERKAVKQ